MKRLMISTAMLTALVLPVQADNHAEAPMFRSGASALEITASDLIGMRVYSSESELTAEEFAGVQDGWEDIGEINDIVLTRDGSVEAVLVDIGGFLGIGERQVAVDMGALKFVSDGATAEDPNDYFLVMNAARADFEAAPQYEWEQSASAEAEAMPDDPNEVIAGTTGVDMSEQERIVRDGYQAAEADFLTTENLTGARVYDANDEWIGEISQLIVTGDGTLSEAVVDVGGFLGIGEKPVALAMDDIDILRSDDGASVRIYVTKTKEELNALPAFNG